MIARGFKPVVWVAAVGAAALGCYMLSLRVASERADLTTLQRRIVATQQQIRALQTEVGTRGRLAQLEQWNDEVLALAPPASGQFVQGAQLARFETHDAMPLDGQTDVQMASAEATPAPPAAPAAPVAQHAIGVAPAVAAPAQFRQASVQRASLTIPSQPAPAPARAQPAPPRAAAAMPARTAATPIRTASATPIRPTAAPARAPTVAPRSIAPAPSRPAVAAPVRTRTASAVPAPRAPAPAHRSSLLDDRTLRDIGAASRAERGGTRD
jgi:hypothetical protein